MEPSSREYLPIKTVQTVYTAVAAGVALLRPKGFYGNFDNAGMETNV